MASRAGVCGHLGVPTRPAARGHSGDRGRAARDGRVPRGPRSGAHDRVARDEDAAVLHAADGDPRRIPEPGGLRLGSPIRFSSFEFTGLQARRLTFVFVMYPFN